MITHDPNWNRWCAISIAKTFQSLDAILPVFVEGFERDTEKLPEFLELRIDGPYISEHARQQWRLYFEVNVLIVVQEENSNAWRLTELTGHVTNKFTDAIQVLRYGTGPDDDQGILGCLDLVKLPDGKIKTSNFGKIRPDARIEQATVEGHYQIFLD